MMVRNPAEVGTKNPRPASLIRKIGLPPVNWMVRTEALGRNFAEAGLFAA